MEVGSFGSTRRYISPTERFPPILGFGPAPEDLRCSSPALLDGHTASTRRLRNYVLRFAATQRLQHRRHFRAFVTPFSSISELAAAVFSYCAPAFISEHACCPCIRPYLCIPCGRPGGPHALVEPDVTVSFPAAFKITGTRALWQPRPAELVVQLTRETLPPLVLEQLRAL